MNGQAMPAPAVPLRLRALGEMPQRIQRSAFRWVVGHGRPFCRGDVLGYCTLGLVGQSAGLGDLTGGAESLDQQLALVARVSGRLHHVASLHGGGWSDRQFWYLWEPQSVLAHVELDSQDTGTGWEDLVDFHFVTGRRACSLAEDRSGLATGWHDRARAWRLGAPGTRRTVMGLGSCELYDTLRGEKGAFVDLANRAPGLHFVDCPERPIIHSARMILDQVRRDDAARAVIEETFRDAIAQCPPGTGGNDWSFAVFAMEALLRCPLLDRHDIVTDRGVETLGPADAVILSIGSEQTTRLRHRRHGFLLDCRGFVYPSLGPAMRDWLKANFEFVSHPVAQVKADYLEMARVLRATNPDLRILVLNSVSTRGSEDIASYAGFDEPMDLALNTVRARELNAMLHDIECEADISIVDSDAIAARLGSSIAVPDGVHQNGEMQALLRDGILAILSARALC